MRLRSEVLRGVKLAAVAFALVLLGALVYRSVDIAVKQRRAPAPQVVAAPAPVPQPAPAVASDPLPAQPPNQSVPKQGGLVAQVRGTGVRAANTRTQKAPGTGSQAEPETAEAANSPEPPPTDTGKEDKAEEAKVDPPEDAATPALATQPEASADAGPAENRGKRMIKAVGRFFRIGGKKEVEPQPARPKQNQQ